MPTDAELRQRFDRRAGIESVTAKVIEETAEFRRAYLWVPGVSSVHNRPIADEPPGDHQH